MKLTVEQLLNKYSKDTFHASEVKRLALMIFDETNKKIHELKPEYREYLAAAALLHDIGYYIESDGHNKHSMRMIIEQGLEGFSVQETKIIGCICRYHRGGLPDKEKHEVYNCFEKKERKIVKRLGGILKIADGFDKRHPNLIKEINLNYDSRNNIAEFILTPDGESNKPDITAAIRKRDLYEIGFKCQSIIKIAI